MPKRYTVRRVVAILVFVAQSGCYNYDPIGRSQPVPSTFLEVRLTDPGSDVLANYLGPDVRVVRGRLVSTTENAFVLSVGSVESRRGERFAWQGETVTVPSEFVWTMQERHPARTKSALMALASVAAFVVTYVAFGPGASGTSPNGGGGGPAPK